MSSSWSWKLPIVAVGTAAAALVLYYLFHDDDDDEEEPRGRGAHKQKHAEDAEQGLRVTQEEMVILEQAQSLFAAGQYEQALAARMNTLLILKREWGTEDYRVFVTAMHFAGDFLAKRRYKEALPLFLDANEIYDQLEPARKKELEPHHVNLRLCIGDAMFGLGYYGPAIEQHRVALELIKPRDPKGVFGVFIAEKLAKSLAADGKSAEAIKVMSSTVSFALLNNKGSSVVYDGQCVLAELHAQQKDLMAAEEVLRMLLADIERRSPAAAVGGGEAAPQVPMSAAAFRAMRLLRSICFQTSRDADALDIERRMGLSPVCVPHVCFESTQLLETGCAIYLYSLGQDTPFGAPARGRATAYAKLRLYLARSWASNPELENAILVVRFRKPDGTTAEDVVEHPVTAEERTALEVDIESPRYLAATRGNYLAVIDIFESPRRAKNLGSLRQFIHCHYSLDSVTPEEAAKLAAKPDHDFSDELKPPPGAQRAAHGSDDDDDDDDDRNEERDEQFRTFDDEELAAVMAEFEKDA